MSLHGRGKPPRSETETGRGTAILAGLEHVGPGAAFSMAGLLGFGGPKRLVLTFLAMATVSEDAVGALGDLALVALYVAVATMLVSVPIVIIVATGDWGVDYSSEASPGSGCTLLRSDFGWDSVSASS